jgi:hypothetical protein
MVDSRDALIAFLEHQVQENSRELFKSQLLGGANNNYRKFS